MGNTNSTSSKKQQKRAASPRKVKQVKKSPFSFGSKKRAPPAATKKSITMRDIKAKMSNNATPVAKKPARNNKRNAKVAKKNDTTSLVKKYGPTAWNKAKSSGVGPFKKQHTPSKKTGVFSKLVSASEKRK